MYIYKYIHALRINHEYICEQLFLKINSTSALNWDLHVHLLFTNKHFLTTKGKQITMKFNH